MFNSKYSNILTVALVIAIIAIIALIAYFGYDIYRKYYTNKGASDAVDAFQEGYVNKMSIWHETKIKCPKMTIRQMRPNQKTPENRRWEMVNISSLQKHRHKSIRVSRYVSLDYGTQGRQRGVKSNSRDRKVGVIELNQ